MRKEGGGSGWVCLFCVDLMSAVLKNNKYLYVILIFNESHKLVGIQKCRKAIYIKLYLL